MDILHAYWRMDYITSESDEKDGHRNPFSELPRMGDDRAALIVHRADHNYLVLNRYPYNPGHLLIVPYREVPDLDDLRDEERHEMMDLIVFAKKMLRNAMHPSGFNVGFNLGKASGAGIPRHLHAHIVPRWEGDANFLTVIGKTRSLPQALEETWEVLHRNKPDA
ncbi:MAG: HIT domain-containing protein [Verrucomicrobia bacterium]|jgi:ATP adenylyltransferase|nr:HIT domain-containing protein [Verrucomicrobiota bacterium]